MTNQSEVKDEFLSPYSNLYAGFATSSSDRQRVAAGGVVTTLLASALRSGIVDGVLLSRVDFSENRMGYTIDIVTDAEKVKNYGKSVYFNIPIEREWKSIESFDGRLAICALPCQVRSLRRLQEMRGRLQHVALIISLFCGHNNELDLWNLLLEKHGIDQSLIVDMRTDRDYMRGKITLTMSDGSTHELGFREFNTYRRLWVFAKDLCRYCNEHLGEQADISVGDIFVKQFLDSEVRHSAVVTRTTIGDALLNATRNESALVLEPVLASDIYAAQRSIIDPSNHSKSRYYANRVLGHKAKKPTEGVFKLSSFFLYLLLFANDRLSRTRFGRYLFKITPMWLLYGFIKVTNLLKKSSGFH